MYLSAKKNLERYAASTVAKMMRKPIFRCAGKSAVRQRRMSKGTRAMRNYCYSKFFLHSETSIRLGPIAVARLVARWPDELRFADSGFGRGR